ncbi:MAG: hypothetical protein ACI9HK_000674 [Pirellulaceae bacterium]|jgi:hypothetical protein
MSIIANGLDMNRAAVAHFVIRTYFGLCQDLANHMTVNIRQTAIDAVV